MPPFLLDHPASRNLYVSVPFAKSTSAHVRVRDDEAHAVFPGTFCKSIRDTQKRGALTSASVLWIHGKHVHVPGVASFVHEFLQRHEHGGKRF